MSIVAVTQKILRNAGLSVKTYSKRKVSDFDHETVTPNATFAPWMSDQSFNNVYSITQNATLVDVYRSYELWQLVGQQVKNDVPGDILEVGVWRGGTTGLMASRLKRDRSDALVYAADTFEGVVGVGEKDSTYRGGEHADTSEDRVRNLLEKDLKCTNVRILKGIFPLDTAHLIPAQTTFRLCHIDVDVYQSAKEILDWVWPRLSVNGIVVFDDYGFYTCDGITRLVEERRDQKDCLLLHNLNGHAIMIKTKSSR